MNGTLIFFLVFVETDEEEAPIGIRSKYSLFDHQKQGLAWLIWRETQEPAGGVLADDMGLGKTLTLISLILKQKEAFEELPNKDELIREEKEWLAKKNKNLVRSKSTLVICPASLMGHWEQEVKSKCKSDRLRTYVYHGQGTVLYNLYGHGLPNPDSLSTMRVRIRSPMSVF